MTTPHNITAIEGQTYLIPLRLLDTHGQPAPLAAYDIYGAVRVGDKPAAMAVQQADSSSCILSIHPLPEGAYAYDLFARQRSTGAEVRLLRGTVTAQRRTATLPPATGAGEEVTLTLSADTTALAVTVSPIVASTPGAVEALETANALLAASMQQADDLVPAAREAIAQEGAAASALVQQSTTSGQQQIAAAVGDGKTEITGAVDAGVFEVGEAATEGVGNIIDTAARKTEEAAATLTATGATIKADIHAAAVRDASAALDLIEAATAKGTDTLDQSVINGTDTLNASTASGKQQIAAATTSGTGTINQTVTNGMALLDGYVGTVSDDIARKSQPNIWGGVHTFNAAAILNGGGIVSTSTPLGADPLADQQRITGLLDGQQLQAMYGGRPLPLTYETHATDAHYDGSKRAGYAFMFGRASAVGAWRSAWLTSQQVISGNMWVNVPTSTGGTRRQTARTGTYAVNILPAASNTDNVTSPPPVIVGLNTFFTGHAAGDSLPPTKRPWDPHIIQQPHHANWNQPKAVICCEAYGHKIATLHIYVGYGGSVTDKDVTPASIRYNCIPCIRYKSPIANVSTITAIYITADTNGQGYYNGTTRTYIQTSDGQLVSVIGTPLDQRYNSVGVLALSKAGTQAAACIRDIVHYPNIRPASYYANAVQYHNPVHPVETWLEANTTHKIQRPAKPLKEKISIAYAAAAPEEYPCDIYNANITGGVMDAQTQGNYGSQLHISKAAQDMQITCPAGWIIDVDDWSTDWCIAEGNTLHILPNDTGAARYVSVWIYAPNNTNTTDGTNAVWEYGINQSAN